MLADIYVLSLGHKVDSGTLSQNRNYRTRRRRRKRKLTKEVELCLGLVHFLLDT